MIVAADSPPLLRMRGIEKSFPGVRALAGVDLELHRGEVLALLGENGAGKSTLIKVLGGAHTPDEGTIEIDGEPVEITEPSDAQRFGIAVIYQEFNLVPALSARENLFLGREKSTAGFIHRDEEVRRTRELFARLGVAIDPEVPCRRLSIAQQQTVEIAKALSLDARIIVMDEPSATLTPQEVEHLFTIVRDLQAQGIGVIYISHRLDEIFALADRVTVLRDGQPIGTRPLADVTREKLIEMMVGRTLEQEFPPREPRVGEVRLRVRGLSRGREVNDVSFDVRGGEIVALTGLVGAGRTEIARLIFGADSRDAGTIEVDGNTVAVESPRDAIGVGICLLTEDRKGQGLALVHSVLENFGLPNVDAHSRLGVLRGRLERDRFASYVEQLRIKISGPEQRAGNLSGGNQQKVVLAKWLARNCDVVIFDEPTRGIDVGSKYEIYLLMNDLAARGKAVVMISSELPEVLGMSDRIIVVHEGRVTGEIDDVSAATQEDVLRLAIG